MNDLYDQLRPADESLDPATADRVWARISGESLDRNAQADRTDNHAHDQDGTQREVVSSRQERTRKGTARPISRRFAAWGAAAAAIAGIGATAAVVGSRDTAVAPTDPLAPVTTVPGAEPVDTTTSPDSTTQETEAAALPSGPIGLSAGTKFAVADYLPDGWELGSMDATASGPLFGGQQWALLDAEGSVTGVVSIRAPRVLSADEQMQYTDDDDLNTTVRGFPASEYGPNAGEGDPVQRSGIRWIEGSLLISMSASGDAQELVRPVAEALMIDGETRQLSIPNNLGLIPSTDLAFADPTAVQTVVAMSPVSSTFGVSITARPNTFGFDLTRLVRADVEWEPILIDDLDAIAATTPGGGRMLAWLDDGMYVIAGSTIEISDSELIDIVLGVRFTDADEFREIGEAISGESNAEIASWDVFDRTSTPAGLGITVRSRPESGGANAICVETTEPECTAILSDGGSIDGFEEYGAVGFDIDGATIGVAWVSDDLVIDSIDWTLRPAELENVTLMPSDFLNPDDGYIDGSTATVLVNERTEQGRFVIVDIPAGERPPAIRFVADGIDPDSAGSEAMFELTPNIANSFSF